MGFDDALAHRDYIALLGAYRSPDRHYHTPEHIGEMLTWFESVR
jgi:predicted metal-dependent HD superfamily phosphohydrolase